MDHDRLRGLLALITGTVMSILSPAGHAPTLCICRRDGLGAEEVDAEVFTDAMAAIGLFPQLSGQEWRDVMIEAYASGAYT